MPRARHIATVGAECGTESIENKYSLLHGTLSSSVQSSLLDINP